MTKKYKIGSFYNLNKDIDLLNIDIFYDMNNSFKVKFIDIFENYIPSIKTQEDYDNWNNHPMKFWQTQLHFAIWCATTGCGISYKNHLTTSKAEYKLRTSIFKFHVYYQIRNILNNMLVPTPQSDAFNATKNKIDMNKYEQICNEFKVSNKTNWQPKVENNGMGENIYIYRNSSEKDVKNKVTIPYKGKYNKRKLTFDKVNLPVWIPNNNIFSSDRGYWRWPDKKQIAYIKQINKQYWKSFILDESEGFTDAGIVRIKESIRTYVYCVLGAQVLSKEDITSAEAQDTFLKLLYETIHPKNPISIATSKNRYQLYLNKASSKLEYVIGPELNITPSNMKIIFNKKINYNNKLLIATKNQKIGLNKDINKIHKEKSKISNRVIQNFIEPKKSDIIAKPEISTSFSSSSSSVYQYQQIKDVITVSGLIFGIFILFKN